MSPNDQRMGRVPPKPSNKEQGVSYVEILLAMTLLTVGIIGAFGAVSTAALDIYDGGRETFASEQAQAILERMRNSASYEDLLSYADNPPPGATSPRPNYVDQNRAAWLSTVQAGASGANGQGQGSITVAQQGTIPNRLATVTVTVDWPRRTGPTPLTFVTQVTEWP